MSNSISQSLNMRTLKEAMTEQEAIETAHEEIEFDEEIDFGSTEIEVSDARNPMEKVYSDMTDLDQTVYEHNRETNDVINMAKDAFDTVMLTAQSVPPDKASFLFEVAGKFLEVMNKASDSKVSAKHDRAKLTVAMTKAQLQAGMVDASGGAGGVTAHRNDILKAILGGNVSDAEFTKEQKPEDENK